MNWDALFTTPTRDGEHFSVPMRCIWRHGQPLLLLPKNRLLAAQALTLYPAQSLSAKAAKGLLRTAILSGVPLWFQRQDLTVSKEAAFPQFITCLTGTSSFPHLAILAGNPDALGQRMVLLLFNAKGRPVAVVKAGIGAEACRLMEKERAFLEEVASSGGRPAVAPLKSTFHNGDCSAIALPFLKGCSPRGTDWNGVAKVLMGWLHNQAAFLPQIPAWQRFSAAACREPSWHALARSLEERQVLPAVFHGDFAPWNVRKSPFGPWIALDWERGEFVGVPGWDWFHWMVHVSLLVYQHNTASSLAWIDKVLQGPEFAAYSEAAHIRGMERGLLAAYLFYLHEWIVPNVIKTPVARLRDAILEQASSRRLV